MVKHLESGELSLQAVRFYKRVTGKFPYLLGMNDSALFTEARHLWAWWTCLALLKSGGFSLQYALDEAWAVFSSEMERY